MWRLLPIVICLGFLELLVPWPDVARLVLSNPSETALRQNTHSGSLVHVSETPISSAGVRQPIGSR
jgi:hypothetical protein